MHAKIWQDYIIILIYNSPNFGTTKIFSIGEQTNYLAYYIK